MNYKRRISGFWHQEQVKELSKFKILINEGYSSFDIVEDSDHYYSIIKIIENTKELDNRRVRAIFDNEDINAASNFLLYDVFANKGISLNTDILLARQDVYPDYCNTCFLPFDSQEMPFIFRKEPKLGKKDILFSANGSMGMLFTTKSLFEQHFTQWGLKCQNVLAGKSRVNLENIVQLLIPKTKVRLDFGTNEFGKQFDSFGYNPDYYPACVSCHRKIYTNRILDVFPKFESEVDENIVKTSEWFNDRNHVVISKIFAIFLEDLGAVKLVDLIPVQTRQLESGLPLDQISLP